MWEITRNFLFLSCGWSQCLWIFFKVFAGMVLLFLFAVYGTKTLLSVAELRTQGTSPWICLLLHYLGRRMVLPWPLSRVVTVAVLCMVVSWHISSELPGVPGQCWITDQGCLQHCFQMAQTGAHHRRRLWLVSAVCCGQGRGKSTEGARRFPFRVYWLPVNGLTLWLQFWSSLGMAVIYYKWNALDTT